jgi:hypothetical protein
MPRPKAIGPRRPDAQGPFPALILHEKPWWTCIAGFPDYEISNDGRIRRITTGSNMKAGTLLKPQRSPSAVYVSYGLSDRRGRRHKVHAHVLVARAFLKKPRSRSLIVLHDNDDPLDCRDCNLKWGTHAENNADGVRNGGIDRSRHPSRLRPWTRPRGEDHSSHKLTASDVRAIMGDLRKCRDIAEAYGVDSALIDRIKKGRVWKHITNPEYAAMLEVEADKEATHLAAIRQLPCVRCRKPAGEAAHLRMSDQRLGKTNPGIGRKPPDRWCTPLCHGCHMYQHSIGERRFWSRLPVDPFALCQRLYAVSPDVEAMTRIVMET